MEMSAPPDRFGRVAVGGNVQDLGAARVIGNQFGFNCCSGELGLSVASAPTDSADPIYGMSASVFQYWGAAATPHSASSTGTGSLCPARSTSSPATGKKMSSPSRGNPGSRHDRPRQRHRHHPRRHRIANLPQRHRLDGSHPHDPDVLFIGLTNGDLYPQRPRQLGWRLQNLPHRTGRPAPPPSSGFTDDRTAFVGYSTGVVVKLDRPVHLPVASNSSTCPAPPDPSPAQWRSTPPPALVHIADRRSRPAQRRRPVRRPSPARPPAGPANNCTATNHERTPPSWA